MFPYLTRRQVAAAFGLSFSFLKNANRTGRDAPPFVRVSSRQILYRAADVEAWLAARLVRPEDSAGPRRRGRPTKAAQKAKARQAAGAGGL